MRLPRKIQRFLLLILIASFAVVSCSDDSTSPDENTPPEIPSDLAPVLVESSFFDENVPNTEEHTGYNQAKSFVNSYGMMGAAGFQAYAGSMIMFMEAYGVEPEFNNGTWTWEFTYSEEMFGKDAAGNVPRKQFAQNELTIRVDATPAGGGVEWDVYITGAFDGEPVNNYRFASGFTSSDGNSGEWNYYLPGSGSSAVYTYEWEVISDDEFHSIATIQGDAGAGIQGTVEYNKNGPEHWLEYSAAGESSANVYWNDETGSGWVEQGGNRSCFSNFENTVC